jgi:hypothetical protein
MSDRRENAICDMLVRRMDRLRQRRSTFEKMGNDDAVRAIEGDLDLVKSIADEVLLILAQMDEPA